MDQGSLHKMRPRGIERIYGASASSPFYKAAGKINIPFSAYEPVIVATREIRSSGLIHQGLKDGNQLHRTIRRANADADETLG